MPGSIRLFVEADLAPGAEISATAGQAHYLGTVMRRGAGEGLSLFNGRDGEWAARIESIRRDRAIMVALEQIRPQGEEPDVWLVFAPLKRDAIDLIVQKATELGASALLPVATERTNTGRLNADRLRAIAIEAAEQCERLTVPRIAPIARLPDLLAAWPPARTLHAAVERSASAPIAASAPGPTALLVGPEGGFTPAELDALSAAPFVVVASLGPRILRAETAAIVGLALLQAGVGG